MGKIGIAVCGNSGIDYLAHEKDLKVFRSILMLDGKEYEDFVDINADDFYKTLVATPDIPASTAQTSTGHILEMYEKMVAEGFDEIIAISISQKLSGTYQNAVLAAKMLEKGKVTVYDSKTLSYVEAKMALEAYQLAKKGKSVEQIVKRLDEIKATSHIWVTVDTLKYLVKGGRVSNIAGLLGSMLKLKPLLEVTTDGKVETIEKIRTTSKARATMVERFTEEAKNLTNIEVFVIYTNNAEDAGALRTQLLALPFVKEVLLVPLTPVVGCHAGPGTLGLGYVTK
ncbi:MAG: DegV family protein [Bacillus subtilis]|nr:DegV family protein [Bacillus subtilis]